MKEGYRPQRYYQQFGKEEGGKQQQRGEVTPFPLLGNIKGFIAEARVNWKGRPERFDAASYLYSQLKSTLRQSVITQAASEETHALMADVMSAYAILAYPHFILDDDRRSVGVSLAVYAEDGVTLDPKDLPLLEAMTEATDIPYTPGQTRFELPSEVIEQQLPHKIAEGSSRNKDERQYRDLLQIFTPAERKYIVKRMKRFRKALAQAETAMKQEEETEKTPGKKEQEYQPKIPPDRLYVPDPNQPNGDD